MSQLICLFLSGFDECLSDLATLEMLFCRDFFQKSMNVSANFNVSGSVRRHLASSGLIWPHLASSGLIWFL